MGCKSSGTVCNLSKYRSNIWLFVALDYLADGILYWQYRIYDQGIIYVVSITHHALRLDGDIFRTTYMPKWHIWKRAQKVPHIYPRVGSSAIARGSSRFSLMRTFLDEPFSRLTSILSVPVSVQYKFRAIQSTATPSGYWMSLETITSASKQVHGEINLTL